MNAVAKALIERYIKIGENGALLSLDEPDWVAVLDTSTNLMWARA